jgi:hypothetical protein
MKSTKMPKGLKSKEMPSDLKKIKDMKAEKMGYGKMKAKTKK